MGRLMWLVVWVAAVVVNMVQALTTHDLLPYGNTNMRDLGTGVDGAYVTFSFSGPWVDGKIVKVREGGPFRYGGKQIDFFKVAQYGFIECWWNWGKDTIYPYFGPVDTAASGVGNVWHRTTTEPSELSLLTSQIRDAGRLYNLYGSFTAARAVVATWEEVVPKDAKQEAREKRNTFQAVLVGNEAGTESFAIFSYVKLLWPGRAFIQLHNQVYKQFYNLPGSNIRDGILQVAHTSNTGTPGRWVFKVSGTTVQSVRTYGETCTSTNPCAQGFQCIGEKCTCPATQHYDSGSCQDNIYGDTCTSIHSCAQGFQCVSRKCACPVNTMDYTNGSCQESLSLGASVWTTWG